MKNYLLPIMLWLTLTGSSVAGGFINLAGEIRLPSLNSWHLGNDTLDYPFQLVRLEPPAELLIFKSIIAPVDAVLSNDELKRSVEKVVDDVILGLPEASLLTSTGYFETYRTSFVIEFISTDSISHVPLYHRLNAILYRHPDGQQLLFTLWAKTDTKDYPTVADELKLIQSGFIYTGPQEASVFLTNRRPYWYGVGLLIIIAGLLYAFRQRTRASKTRLSISSGTNFWRCDCGQLNRSEHKSCGQCGEPRRFRHVGNDNVS